MDNAQSTQGPPPAAPPTPVEAPPAKTPATSGVRPELAGVLFGASGVIAGLVGLFSNLGQLVSLSAGPLVSTLSLGVVIILAALLLGTAPVKRNRLAAALAVIVLLSGLSTFALSWDERKPAKSPPALPAWHRQGAPNQPLIVEMGPADRLPQGSFYLDPPRPGPDAYIGDVTIECTTPGKPENVQNCTGNQARFYAVEPVNRRSLMAAAVGDAFADAGACEESAGADYQAVYLEIAKNKTYCLRLRGDLRRVVAMRVVSWPTEQPRPIRVVMETTTWVR
jgi:hypothetical protein